MPATPTIDEAFIQLFEAEVKLDYQRMGSRLAGLARRANQVVGSSVRFQKMGTGTAQAKARHGDVPVLNLEHSYVDAYPTDSYGAEYIDDLDMLKTNIDERGAVTRSITAATGRSTDGKIVAALDTSTNNDTTSSGLTLARVILAQQTFNTNDVPMDGQRYMAIGPAQWSDLLAEDEFVSADYVGQDALPYKGGLTAKRWLDFIIFPYTGLTLSTTRRCKAWHKFSVGLGVGLEFSLQVAWVAQKDAWLITGKESTGAVLIDQAGVYGINCTDP